MNKATLASFTISSLLIPFLLSACNVAVKASPVIYVPADYSTIQEAVNNADEGDTIFVYAGTYNENVLVMNKSLSIIGEDRNRTIIDGNETENTILIRETTDLTIKNFTVRGSGGDYSGISLYRSNNIRISHNLITNNFYGVRSHVSSFDNMISDSTITDNNYGISFDGGLNNMVSENNISKNSVGILLLGSDENTISRNEISSNTGGGIHFLFSTKNTVSENAMTDNNPGMYFYLSSDNIIYHNSFNNTNQIESDNGNGMEANYWDNGHQGNYWSDYNGTDFYMGPYQNETGSDGIGETPYIINEKNIDNHPLMGSLSIFSVVSEAEIYRVSTICNLTISDFRFRIGRETGNRVIQFNVTGKENASGFCRVMIPTDLMKEPYIILVGMEEINSTRLGISNETHVFLYLAHVYDTVSIISSKMWHFYHDLTDKIVRLEDDLWLLNEKYNSLQSNYSQLHGDYVELNDSYYDFLDDYAVLLSNWTQLHGDYVELNDSYYDFLDDYAVLLSNWTQLRSDHFEEVRNTENLTYSFAALAAIFLIVTVYLSRHAHLGKDETLRDEKGGSSITP